MPWKGESGDLINYGSNETRSFSKPVWIPIPLRLSEIFRIDSDFSQVQRVEREQPIVGDLLVHALWARAEKARLI